MGRSRQSTSISVATFFCSFPHCGETFSKLSNLRRHLKNQHEGKAQLDSPYQCDFPDCGKQFRKRKQLYDHRFHAHNQEKKMYPCSKCPAILTCLSRLNLHMKRHEGYPCTKCQFKAETWSVLRRHNADAHPPIHLCQVCKKTFKRRGSMKKHERLHQKMVECPCSECDQLMFPWNVASHVKANHAHLLPDCRQLQHMDDVISSVLQSDTHSFECSKCGKTFPKARGLRIHKRTVHEKDGEGEDGKQALKRTSSFHCTMEYCNRAFVNEKRLQAHMNCHAGNQPFQCPEIGCKSKFAGRSALQRHLKWKHLKTLQAYEVVEQLVEMCGNEEMEEEEEM